MANDIRVKRFWTEHEIVQHRAPRMNALVPGELLGEAKLEGVDWVEYVTRIDDQGNAKSTNVERVASLDPVNLRITPGMDGGEKEMFFRMRWEQIEPSYLAWKAGNELPEHGTPLALWAGLTPEQVNVFKLAGIRSVEAIRDMTASEMQRVRLPNVNDIKRLAGVYLESSGAAQSAAREAAKDAQMANMRDEIDALRELLQDKLSDKAGLSNEPVAAEGQEEVDLLRAELDSKGIAYHHKAGAGKLRELLNGQAA